VIDEHRTQPRPRARPVADVPAERLIERADELARGWVIALVRAHPLETIGELPLEHLALEAPALCRQIIRAVQSDSELARLTGEAEGESRGAGASVRRIPAIAGVSAVEGAVRAVEALRGVLWQALRDQLDEPSAREVGDIADRLAYVCAAALEAALAAADPQPSAGPAERDRGTSPSRAAPPGDASALDDPRVHGAGAQATIVDELTASRMAQEVPSPPMRAGEIEIRDVRGAEGPAAWIGSIGGQLERFEHDRAPFAVLLVELVDSEQLARGAGALDRVERELAAALGARGSLTRERPGRYWLVTPGTDRGAAGRLAERLRGAVATGATDLRLEVAVGIAVCPDDGRQASTIAAHADVDLYADRSALRAAGRRVGTVDERA
jgi:GGDEF domain-containing protein